MANYQILKADIDEKIYENAQQKITGENLNSILNAMVANLGAEYQFAGVATIDTNPETSDAKVFYIANGKGKYTNFGNIEVTEDDVVILYYDTTWHKVATGIASNEKLSELEEQITDEGDFNLSVASDKWIDTKYKVLSGLVYTFNVTSGRFANERVLDANGGILETQSVNVVAPTTIQLTFSNDGYLSLYAVNTGSNLAFNINSNRQTIVNRLSKNEKDTSFLREQVGEYYEYGAESWSVGYYTVSIGNALPSQPTSTNTSYRSIVVPIKKGDVIKLYAIGQGSANTYNLADTNRVVYFKGEDDFSLGGELVAPEDGYICINSITSVEVYKAAVYPDNLRNLVNSTKDSQGKTIEKNSEDIRLLFTDSFTPSESKIYGLDSFSWMDGKNIDSDGTIVNDNGTIMMHSFLDTRGMTDLKFILPTLPQGASMLYKVAYYDLDKNFVRVTSFGEGLKGQWFPFIKIALNYYDGTSYHNKASEYPLDEMKVFGNTNEKTYPYSGQTIKIQPRVAWRIVAQTIYAARVQGASCYDGILFQFHDQNIESEQLKGVEIFDLNDGGRLLQTIILGYEDGVHNNAVTFGSQRYDANDRFPLLYASTLWSKKLYVYRITENNGVFGMSKVQEISLDASLVTPDAFADARGYIYVRYVSNNMDVFDKYAMPSVHDGNVTLTDKLDTFSIPEKIDGGEQGGEIINGILYHCTGFADRNYLEVIDLDAHKKTSEIFFKELGLNYEPESVFYHNGKLGVSFNSSGLVVELSFL